MHFSRRASRQALHRSARRQLGQSDLPLPLVCTTSLLFPTRWGAPCDCLLVKWHITHVLDTGTKSCSYVHEEWHCQEQYWITGTTCALTRGDLQAGGGDNLPNGGDGDVASIDIGGDAAAVADKRSKATGNKLKPTRSGDLRWTTWFPWPRATCSKTFLCAARQAHAPESLLWRFKSTGNCTTPSAAAAHGMGTMPLVGIIQQIWCKMKHTRRSLSMDHWEGTCLISNIVARVGYHNTLWAGDVIWNTNMNRGNGTKNSITPQQLGDVLEYCFRPGKWKIPN